MSTVKLMNNTLAHRGPNDEGVIQDKNVTLGHRRLSILDLSSAGHQPMWSHDHRYVIVFNGEIYNYRELKDKLSKAYLFKTQTDTEVILAAYQQWGSTCIEYFNGMFAFAIWDTLDKVLFIARDRLGIKPLYFYHDDHLLIFSSEIRALLSSGYVPKKISTEALIDFLRYQTVHAPATILHGVSMLLPGHYMMVQDNQLTIKKYWSLDKVTAPHAASYHDTKKKIRELLSKAVERRLVADVPFGAFLSGGIDSSTIVGLMSLVSSKKVSTFSVTFGEREFSEAQYAKLIADKFHTDHHEIYLKPDDFLECLPEAIKAMDHPSGDGPNTYIVSKVTKEAGIDMALSGLGGDELFAGYDIFKRAKLLKKYAWVNNIPKSLRYYIADTAFRRSHAVTTKKIAKIFQNDISFYQFYPFNRLIFFEETIRSLLTEYDNYPNSVSVSLANTSNLEKLPFLSRVSFAEISSYMQHVLLRDTDQMSMAHALEVRVPFLDHELVEYVMNVPDIYKFPHSPKKLLVDSVSDLLPDAVVNRPKMGFVLPWEHWLKNELKTFAQHRIDHLGERAIFNNACLQDLWSQFLHGSRYISWSRIWQLIVLENWLEKNNIDL